jgi:hypothetical protein
MMITATSRVQLSILPHNTPATQNPLPKMQIRLKKREKKTQEEGIPVAEPGRLIFARSKRPS